MLKKSLLPTIPSSFPTLIKPTPHSNPAKNSGVFHLTHLQEQTKLRYLPSDLFHLFKFMSSNKKNLLKTLLTANAGSCGCGRLKLSDVYEPKPKPKSKIPATTQNPKLCSSDKKNSITALSSAMESDDLTSTCFSFNIDTITSSTTLNSESETDLPRPSKIMLSPCPKIVDSIAVVKVSNDPYQDFRHSMLQMILEREIYLTSDLQELLQCFLELNSPCHHDVIVKAFTEIWNQVMSKEINVTVEEQTEEPCAVVHGEKHGILAKGAS